MVAGFGFGVVAGHRVTIAHAASIVSRSGTLTTGTARSSRPLGLSLEGNPCRTGDRRAIVVAAFSKITRASETGGI